MWALGTKMEAEHQDLKKSYGPVAMQKSIFRKKTFIPIRLWTPNAHKVSLVGVHSLVGISTKYIYSHKAMDIQCCMSIMTCDTAQIIAVCSDTVCNMPR
jgi:S-ribosylhomocysteine lyase LuxS involved in autoinducer biosynthesis